MRDVNEVITHFEVDVPVDRPVGEVPLSDLPARLTIEFEGQSITLNMTGFALVQMLMQVISDVVQMTNRKGVPPMPGALPLEEMN